MLAVAERFGSLQFDPLEVTGARNHELVLFARIANFRRELCNDLLYPKHSKRRLFEAYNKSLNLLPVGELPWHRFAWKRAQGRHAGRLLIEHSKLAKRMLSRLRDEGPLAPSDFDATEGKESVKGHWGVPTSLTRHVLDALFMTGRVGIARREGTRRIYDLTARLFDRELLARRVSASESIRHRLLSRHRAVGLMGRTAAPELVYGIATASERNKHLKALVDGGALHEVSVEGLRGPRYVLAEERSLLLARDDIAPHVSFIAPLDPFVWDRELVRDLFGFDYKWEVYTPAAKRAHGYYALPILFGERLVGRIEPRLQRQTPQLDVLGIWLERGFDPETDGFVSAFGETLRAFATFVGAERVKLGRGKTCRWIAVRLPS